MIFSIGDITFAAEAHQVDANGVSWGLDVLDGWWDTPALRSEAMDLPLRDGSSVSDGYRSGRVLSLQGGIVHPDTWVTAEAFRQLTSALDIIRTDGIFIASEPTPKMLTVRRAAPIDVTWIGPAIKWETTLVAADWRKYETSDQGLLLGPYTTPTDGLDYTTGATTELGIDLATGAGVDLGIDFPGTPGAFPDQEAVNAGTAPTYPVIEFRGPSAASMTSFKITNLTTGQVLQIDTTVNSGESLFADMAAAYGISVGSPITLSGVSRYGGWVAPRTPWYLAPGTNLLRFQVLAGTATGATAHITWRSAWE